MSLYRASLNHPSWLLLGSLLLSGPLAAQDFPGTSEWDTRVTLSTTVDGRVDKVQVAAGDRVARGALLLEIDPGRYRTRMAAAEARREEQRLLREEAQRELDRSLELYDRTMLSDHDRKLAQIDAARAEAAFREAEAALVEARLRWEYSRIRAPFDGLVLALHVQPGEAVVNRLQAVPLVTLVDRGRMRARTRVDAKTLARLRRGDAVQVGVRGVWLEGEIAGLGFDPLAGDAGYRLEARFTPPEGMDLRSGEKLMIRLPDE